MYLAAIFVVVLASSQASIIQPFNNDHDKTQEIQLLHENTPKALQEDATLLVPDLIRKYGYPCEVHHVITSDEYVLEMHRIPYGRDGPSANRPAVYLQHGILASSADWVIPGVQNGLAYILADAGYDVWMGNVRGTRYSRKHMKLDPNKHAKEFWDFSWHEIAVHDLPAMIDYVTDYVKQEQIFYIGHSQGTTVFYVLCSVKPEYNRRFRLMVSLAPVGYMKHMTSPLLRIIAFFDGPLTLLFNMIGMHEFLPTHSFLAQLGESFCKDASIFQILCTNSLFAVCGFSPNQMNATLLPVVMGHTPAGAATKQLLHYSQGINSGKFRHFDYGKKQNKKRYGSKTPPNYDLKKVTAPIYLFYSNNDWLSHTKDVLKLYNELGNVLARFNSLDKKFNHVDYVYGIDAPKILYSRVLGRMKMH